MTLDTAASVWLTGFWGFTPEEEGILGFTDPRDRDRLFDRITPRQLVCIYGAASPEADPARVHHLLGVLEVECTPLDSWDKMSQTAQARNITLGRQDKWRHAMPVRRAWRTTRNLDVGQVFPLSYDAQRGRYIARFGTWLDPKEARWLLTQVPFTAVPVFGEPPLAQDQGLMPHEGVLFDMRAPSRGVFGRFGDRTVTTTDRPHHLYLAQFVDGAALLAGHSLPKGAGVIEIGISGILTNRLKALNLSFPKTAGIGWTIMRKASFPDRAGAAKVEADFKTYAMAQGATSLGREFFVMDLGKADALFTALSPASGLTLRVDGARP